MKVEIVDECSSTNNDYPCGIIRCEPHQSNSKAVTGSVGLLNYSYCNPELVVGQMIFTFHYGQQPNGDIPFYWSSEPTSTSDSIYIYDTALHEIGHILQLGHVRDIIPRLCIQFQWV